MESEREQAFFQGEILTLKTQLAAAQQECKQWHDSYDALLFQARTDNLRAEDADRFEQWLLEIGKHVSGCEHVNEQLPSCVLGEFRKCNDTLAESIQKYEQKLIDKESELAALRAQLAERDVHDRQQDRYRREIAEKLGMQLDSHFGDIATILPVRIDAIIKRAESAESQLAERERERDEAKVFIQLRAESHHLGHSVTNANGFWNCSLVGCKSFAAFLRGTGESMLDLLRADLSQLRERAERAEKERDQLKVDLFRIHGLTTDVPAKERRGGG